MNENASAPARINRRAPVYARNIVATSQPLAAQAGIQALKDGGNAVDAALATAITLTVVEPSGNGLGSDVFAIVWDGKQLHGLNASGRSPLGWAADRFAAFEKMPKHGWESVTVPGAVSAWRDLSAKFGKLPFPRLFDAAIDYAKNGFPVSPAVAERWADDARVLGDQPGFREGFLSLGRPPHTGEVFRNENLARSLAAIAESNGDAFYHGELARKIASFARQHNAALTEEDLAEHTNEWCGTISTPFAGTDVHEIPPNGQGIAALIALGILAHTEIADTGPDSVSGVHLQIEAMKLAFADAHAYVADPATMDVRPQQLLDPDYLKGRAALIDRGKAKHFQAGAPTQGGTVYLSTGDENGMMVSFIQSNYSGFGSGIVIPGTGIHMQNRGSGFSLDPKHPNFVAPRKRPFHTIIPAFVTKEGHPLMSFGVMGGPMQAQGHVQIVLRTELFGQDPQSASDAARWRYVSDYDIAVESHMDARTIQGLEALGHRIKVSAPDAVYGFGGAQLVRRMDSGCYVAGSDHRKDGLAIGF